MTTPWVVGVSGASGTPYAKAVICALLEAGHHVDLVISRAARLTLLDETGVQWNDGRWKDTAGQWLGIDDLSRLAHWAPGDLAAFLERRSV